MHITLRCWSIVVFFALVISGTAVFADTDGPLGVEERQQIESVLRSMSAKLQTLKEKVGDREQLDRDRVADAELFAKGIVWALKYDETFSPSDRSLLKLAVDGLKGRVTAIEAGESPWTSRKGKLIRGFVSGVDGSVQPYGVVVPARYDRAKPMRLDVVLHGSSKPVGMSELRFISRFDEGDGPSSNAPEQDYIELHPLGRVENGYRWAGETDVFEAIDAVCRNYAVDRDRIVLRGMSMGASGTWHLGLKHPDRFVALGPYCGYVDTHEFSKTPMPNFVEVGPLPPDQEKMLHILDSVDYAANAGVVPAIACMGEKDVFFQAHEIMKRAMGKEGLAMVNLISPGTGHVVDPVTHREQMRRIGEVAVNGLDHSPKHIRFVTWTLKYGRCHWLQVLGMGEHYARAEIEARVEMDGTVVVTEPKNVARFSVLPPVAGTVKSIRVGDDVFSVPIRANRPGFVVAKKDEKWAYVGELDRVRLEGKRPGLQGPIDDALTTPFLCVRGTGTAWNRASQTWADANLKRFSYEWNRYFRGELPVKDDVAVTEEDARRYNLILFGDPGSNSWIARVLPRLPVRWTREECTIGETSVAAASHALTLIQPNPLAEGRYVVINSGHTFHEKELASLNYLLFPRLGDWSIVKLPDDPAQLETEVRVRSGFFDEDWKATKHITSGAAR